MSLLDTEVSIFAQCLLAEAAETNPNENSAWGRGTATQGIKNPPAPGKQLDTPARKH